MITTFIIKKLWNRKTSYPNVWFSSVLRDECRDITSKQAMTISCILLKYSISADVIFSEKKNEIMAAMKRLLYRYTAHGLICVAKDISPIFSRSLVWFSVLQTSIRRIFGPSLRRCYPTGSDNTRKFIFPFFSPEILEQMKMAGVRAE